MIPHLDPAESEGKAELDNARRSLVDLVLTLALVVLAAGTVFRYFVLYGKSFVWRMDGLGQHYPALHYFNVWVRGILSDPGLGVPLWSWDMGLGADIVGTLVFPVLGDPFALISLAFPMTGLEQAYAVMFALRLLVAGSLSALYFRVMGAKPLPSAIGAVIYLFATFLLIQGRHPYFINGMVFLPLLLVGIEWALRDRRPWFLSVSVFLTAVANFYFFYILTILSVIYAIARYLEITPRARRWTGLRSTGLRVAGFYALGAGLAAPLLLPAGAAVLATARSQTDYAIGLLYPVREYALMLGALASGRVGPNSTHLGFAYLGLLLAPALYVARRGRAALRFMIVAFVVLLSLPVFGSLFNGGTFPSNRFAFAWGLFLALGAALLLSEDRPFSRRELRAMIVGFVTYVATLVVLFPRHNADLLLPVVFGALTIAVFALESTSGATAWSERARIPRFLPKDWQAPLTRWAVVGLLVLNIAANGMFVYDVRFQDRLSSYVDRGEVLDLYRRNTGRIAASLPSDHFFRINNNDTLYYNSSMVQGFPSTSFYFSTMNGNLTDFRSELDSRTGWSSFAYDGFDDRLMPTALVATEYYLAKKGDADFVPYGFSKSIQDGRAVAYRNQHPLPLGFVYEHAIARSDYLDLAPVDRQSAMLQGAVVDDADVGSIARIKPTTAARVVPYQIESVKDAVIDLSAGTIVRTSDDANVVLAFDPVPDAELYVEIANFDNVVVSPAEQLKAELGDEASWIDRIRIRRQALGFRQPSSLNIRYTAGGASKTERWKTPESPYYWGDRSQLVNMGYHADGLSRLRIRPYKKGTLRFESLTVYALPMAEYAKRIAQLNQRAMEDVRITTNQVTGTVNGDRPGILFLSIPYSSGWSAEIDGEPVETIRVNTGFVGLPVAAGEHEVTLRYFTPGLRIGLMVGGVTLVLALLVLCGATFKRRRHRV